MGNDIYWIRFEVSNRQGNLFNEQQGWHLDAGRGREHHVWEDTDARFDDHFGVTRRFVGWSDAPFRIGVVRRYEDEQQTLKETLVYASVPAPDYTDLADWESWMTDEAYRAATQSAETPQPVKTGQPRRR